jgi:AraC-like DNA-binding protein
MLGVQASGPCRALRPYVRCYLQRSGSDTGVLSVDPVVARLEQVIEFHFKTRYEIHPTATEMTRVAPLAAVIGPQTARHFTVFIQGPVDAFAIILQHAGFHRLFRIPLSEFTDDGTEASSVFGSVIMSLRERLGGVNTFAERVRIAESFLLHTLAQVDDRDPFASVAACLLKVDAGSRISEVASQTGLSLRQFERRFHQYAGVPPKLFAKIARFQAALEMKVKSSAQSWITVAHANEYFDQMHMIRDFRELGGATPSRVSADIPSEHIDHLLGFLQQMS